MNLRRSCSTDFSSVAAFDRHGTGTHEYTSLEGVQLGREDGRRCMDDDEMMGVGMELDSRGRWRIIPSASQEAFYAASKVLSHRP